VPRAALAGRNRLLALALASHSAPNKHLAACSQGEHLGLIVHVVARGHLGGRHHGLRRRVHLRLAATHLRGPDADLADIIRLDAS